MSHDLTVCGLPLDKTELPDGAVVLDAMVSLKVLGTDGEVFLAEAATAGLSTWEALGMATTCADALRRALLEDD